MKQISKNMDTLCIFFIAILIISIPITYKLNIKKRNDNRFSIYTRIYLERSKELLLEGHLFIENYSLLNLSRNKEYKIEDIFPEQDYEFGRDGWGNPIYFMINQNSTYIWSSGPNKINDKMLKDDLVVSFSTTQVK